MATTPLALLTVSSTKKKKVNAGEKNCRGNFGNLASSRVPGYPSQDRPYTVPFVTPAIVFFPLFSFQNTRCQPVTRSDSSQLLDPASQSCQSPRAKIFQESTVYSTIRKLIIKKMTRVLNVWGSSSSLRCNGWDERRDAGSILTYFIFVLWTSQYRHTETTYQVDGGSNSHANHLSPILSQEKKNPSLPNLPRNSGKIN